MEKKIDIAKILKDCPRGMELDCTIYDGVTLDSVVFESDCHYDGKNNYPIKITTKNGFSTRLTKYGQNVDIEEAKCMIFPKGKTTWEGFVPPCKFKDGDVIVDKYGAVAIYKRVHSSYEKPYVDFYCGITSKNRNLFIKDSDSLQHCGEIDSIRFATEEEKEELFNIISERGYKWDPETKTLETLIKPKFKVGDRIKHIVGREEFATIKSVEELHYNLDSKVGTSSFSISLQREWELAPNKFDINALKPFDKVLVRCSSIEKWRIQFFEKYDKTYRHPFVCMEHSKYKQCIPYNGNEHLLDNTDECSEYYKTW